MNGIRESACPEQFRLDELVRKCLAAEATRDRWHAAV